MPRLHHIGITVSDTVAATAFYRAATEGEVIGPLARAGPRSKRRRGIRASRFLLTFIRLADGVFLELAEYRGADAPRIDPDNGHIGAAHPAIVVPDIEASLARLAALGHRPLSQIMTATPGRSEGYRYVYVLGPDEVRVELLQKPH